MKSKMLTMAMLMLNACSAFQRDKKDTQSQDEGLNFKNAPDEAGLVRVDPDDLKKFPWIAAVGSLGTESFDADGSFCTATLIAADKILTAHHCVESFNENGPEVMFRMGYTETGAVDRALAKRYVEKILAHGDRSGRNRYKGDWAIAKLAQPIHDATPIKIHALSPEEATDQPRLISVGYPAVRRNSKDANTPMIAYPECTFRPVVGYPGISISQNMLTTCFPETRGEFWGGVSGGPTLLRGNAEAASWQIVGVHSAQPSDGKGILITPAAEFAE